MKDTLSHYIHSCLSTFNETPAPGSIKFPYRYVSICQSSGYGKTALVYQLRDEFYLIYICLRAKRIVGEPKRSPYVADLFETSSRATKDMDNFFINLIYTLIQLMETAGGVIDSQKFFEDNFLRSDKFYNKVKDIYDAKQQFGDEALKKAAKKFQNRANKPLLFVFDEAKALLENRVADKTQFEGEEIESEDQTLFRSLRKVFSQELSNCFSIFMDTSSKISNFSPASKWDPSLRKVEGISDLFPPFTEFTTIGVIPIDDEAIVAARKIIRVDNYNRTLEYNPLHIINFNRPLYSSMLQKRRENLG